ncbi:MAG: hypothetical protein OXF02_05090 [Simkaniaceae bacterium]|nr:hypothetical protein [Simkaniaceae bacterium]
MTTNHFYALPSSLAMARDRADAHAMQRINDRIMKKNGHMRDYVYPLMHSVTKWIRRGDPTKTQDLTQELQRFDRDAINMAYAAYKEELLEVSATGAIQNGAAHELLPPDLKAVDHDELVRIESALMEWRDGIKHFTDRKTQDLYFMIQVTLMLMSAFQNMQRDMHESAAFMVRKQVVQ